MAHQIPRINDGDEFVPDPEDHNRLADLANSFPRPPELPAGELAGQSRSSGIIIVRNTSGAAVPCGGVLGLYEPSDKPVSSGSPDAPGKNSEFLSAVRLIGITPTVDHAGKFVVTLEPIPNGHAGKCQVSGVVPCRLVVIDEAHKHAEISTGITGYLRSAEFGSARIVWKDSAKSFGVVILQAWMAEPIGELQEMVRKNVTQNSMGSDFLQSHALP